MRRVGIFRLVGMLMMVAMVVGPPERAPLHGGTGPEGEQELAKTGSAVRLMRKVAVKYPGHGKHPYKVKRDGGPHREPTPACPDHTQAAQMQHDERNAADKINPIGLRADGLGRLDGIVRVNPLDEGAEESRHGDTEELEMKNEGRRKLLPPKYCNTTF